MGRFAGTPAEGLALNPPADVPLVDLAAQHAEVGAEIEVGFARVIESAAFVGGTEVAAFEREYASAAGARCCVGVASGTDAVELALRAAGLGEGAEVLLPANTFVATAEAVLRARLTPVLVDVDPEFLLLDPGKVRERIGPRSRAVVPVHLFGQMAPMEELASVAEEYGLVVVEDGAQAQGARRGGLPVGARSTAATTSFYPSKNLGAYGDGGAVTTDDVGLADAVRRLGSHGIDDSGGHRVIGMTSRLDALQAVVLRAKLRRLEAWNAARRAAAWRYTQLLAGVPDVQVPAVAVGNDHVWHQYVIRIPDRDEVQARLAASGVATGCHYRTPVHLTPAFALLGDPAGTHPVAEAAAGAILSLPMFPHITAAQQERVVSALAEALA